LTFGDQEQDAIGKGTPLSEIQKLPVRQKLSRMKWIPEKDLQNAFDGLELEMGQAIAGLGGA
ncbi:MAG TPA: V-type ATP synthase subunit A, partial [Thermoplasmata archaeon]|nr:V-type ATP synthase subunit A [Thermoplasmata archaeon]